MKTVRIFLTALSMCVVASSAMSQTRYQKTQDKAHEKLEKFRKKTHDRYESTRDKANKKYVDLLRRSWKRYQVYSPTPRPIDEEIPPVVTEPPVDPVTPPVEPIPRPVVIDDDIFPTPLPSPQPKPVEPIPITPITIPMHDVDFTFFGTEGQVNIPQSTYFGEVNSNNDIAAMWQKLSGEEFNPLTNDCLRLRDELDLCDWAYLQMVDAMSKEIASSENAAKVLAAFVMSQSGYKVRLGRSNNKLVLLFTTDHYIYDYPYVYNPSGEYFYMFGEDSGQIEMCDMVFDGEKQLSLWIPKAQKFNYKPSQSRTLTSVRDKNVTADVVTNTNLIDFYSTYPTSTVDNNVMTRWAMYADTPMDKEVASRLYPQLRKAIEGKGELESVAALLHWVQTSLVYEYDDKAWGGDRAFFAEESLYYPGCDCEDHAILFSRLVRDIIGCDAMLILYPGHMAAAVELQKDQPQGDFIQTADGRKFMVCDPTIKGWGAEPGVQMKDMSLSDARYILLRR